MLQDFQNLQKNKWITFALYLYHFAHCNTSCVDLIGIKKICDFFTRLSNE